MRIPSKKNNEARRKKLVRSVLNMGPKHKKGRLSVVKQYIAENFKMILATLLIVAVVYTHIYYFNRLTVMEQQISNTQANIDSGLQKRQNFIHGLADVVNRFITHERGVFTNAMETRREALGVSEDLKKLIQSARALSQGDISPSALSRLIAVAENYPQLVSSQPYQLLVGQIADAESQVYEKRIEYNNAVNVFNTRLSTFPGNLVGRILRFHLHPYFTWDNEPEWVFAADGQPPELLLEERPPVR